jgi:hypothetical protein
MKEWQPEKLNSIIFLQGWISKKIRNDSARAQRANKISKKCIWQTRRLQDLE